MKLRSTLPLLAVLPLLMGFLGSCGSGEGLRVEGPGGPVSSAATSPKPDRSIGPANTPQALSVPALRQVLLRDPAVRVDMKNLVKICKFGCVQPGVVLTPAGESPKQAVTISTVSGGAFVVLLIDHLVTAPKVVWQTQGDSLTVSVGKGSTLVVESSVFGQSAKACCPSGSKVDVYRWNKELRRMVKVSR